MNAELVCTYVSFEALCPFRGAAAALPGSPCRPTYR